MQRSREGMAAGNPDYGFENFPTKEMEMPPTWAMGIAAVFLFAALGFWVCVF
jgi:hypothetical protein